LVHLRRQLVRTRSRERQHVARATFIDRGATADSHPQPARAPDGFSNIDDILSFEQRKAIVRGYASAAGFAREQVNKAA